MRVKDEIAYTYLLHKVSSTDALSSARRNE